MTDEQRQQEYARVAQALRLTADLVEAGHINEFSVEIVNETIDKEDPSGLVRKALTGWQRVIISLRGNPEDLRPMADRSVEPRALPKP